jgi:hypothetical protein
MKTNKLMILALALGSIFPIVNSSQIAMAQTPRYRVSTSFVVDRSGDGPGDNTLEVYGEVRINGVVNSSISRSNAIDRTSGQFGPIFMIGSKVVTGNTLTINALLNDRDTLSSDDPVFRMPALTIDLTTTQYIDRFIPYVSPSGEGATLHVRVSRMSP